jgi:hypothetical protein
MITGGRNQITQIVSRDGESVDLWLAIPTDISCEVWLKRLEDSMQKALKHHIIMTFSDMDRDVPHCPEDHKELKKYKLSNKF